MRDYQVWIQGMKGYVNKYILVLCVVVGVPFQVHFSMFFGFTGKSAALYAILCNMFSLG